MKLPKLYLVWDNRAQGIVGLPFIQRHDGAATRTFAEAFQNEQAGLSRHPQDFDLYCIGELGDDFPSITPETRIVAEGAAIYAGIKAAQEEANQ